MRPRIFLLVFGSVFCAAGAAALLGRRLRHPAPQRARTGGPIFNIALSISSTLHSSHDLCTLKLSAVITCLEIQEKAS